MNRTASKPTISNVAGACDMHAPGGPRCWCGAPSVIEAGLCSQHARIDLLDRTTWPEPTEPEPDLKDLERMIHAGVAEATDGCEVEPDGWCPHGHVSWLLYAGLI